MLGLINLHDVWIDLARIQKSRRVTRSMYNEDKQNIDESEKDYLEDTINLLRKKTEKIKIANSIKKSKVSNYQSDDSVKINIATDFCKLQARLGSHNISMQNIINTIRTLEALVVDENVSNKKLKQTFSLLDRLERYIQAEE